MLLCQYLDQFRQPLTPLFNEPWDTPEHQRAFEQKMLLGGLRDGLAWWANQAPGHAWLVSLMRQYAAGDPDDIEALVHPDDVLEVVSWFGFGRDSDLDAIDLFAGGLKVRQDRFWLGVIGQVRINYDSLRVVQNHEMLEAMQQQLNCSPTMAFRCGDLGYRLPTRAMLDALLRACPARRYRYLPNRRDCEDYAGRLKTYLSDLGYGDLAVGSVGMECLDGDGNNLTGHGASVALVDDEQGGIRALLIEPQLCQVVSKDYGINGAVSNRIFEAVFSPD